MSDQPAPLIARRSASDVNMPLRESDGNGTIGYIWKGWTEMPQEDGSMTGAWASDSVAGRFLMAMKVGNFQSRAAEYAGVAAETIHRWLRTGRDHMPDDVSDGVDLAELDPEWRPYVQLVFDLRKSEAQSEVELVTLWRSAAKDDWRAARDLLARRHPERWKERVGSEISGRDGGPVQMVAVTDAELARTISENPEARRLASELLAQIAPAAPPDMPPEEGDDGDEDIEDAELVERLSPDAPE